MAEGINRHSPGYVRAKVSHYNVSRLGIKQMLRDADKDGDPVSIVVLTNGPIGDDLAADGAIVVLKGGDTVALFCQWAERNKVRSRWPGVDDDNEADACFVALAALTKRTGSV